MFFSLKWSLMFVPECPDESQWNHYSLRIRLTLYFFYLSSVWFFHIPLCCTLCHILRYNYQSFKSTFTTSHLIIIIIEPWYGLNLFSRWTKEQRQVLGLTQDHRHSVTGGLMNADFTPLPVPPGVSALDMSSGFWFGVFCICLFLPGEPRLSHILLPQTPVKLPLVPWTLCMFSKWGWLVMNQSLRRHCWSWMQQEPLKLCTSVQWEGCVVPPCLFTHGKSALGVSHSREPYLWWASGDAAKAVKSVLSGAFSPPMPLLRLPSARP